MEQGAEGGLRAFGVGEEVDGIFQRDSADGLETAPDFYAQVGGLGWELVKQG